MNDKTNKKLSSPHGGASYSRVHVLDAIEKLAAGMILWRPQEPFSRYSEGLRFEITLSCDRRGEPAYRLSISGPFPLRWDLLGGLCFEVRERTPGASAALASTDRLGKAFLPAKDFCAEEYEVSFDRKQSEPRPYQLLSREELAIAAAEAQAKLGYGTPRVAEIIPFPSSGARGRIPLPRALGFSTAEAQGDAEIQKYAWGWVERRSTPSEVSFEVAMDLRTEGLESLGGFLDLPRWIGLLRLEVFAAPDCVDTSFLSLATASEGTSVAEGRVRFPWTELPWALKAEADPGYALRPVRLENLISEAKADREGLEGRLAKSQARNVSRWAKEMLLGLREKIGLI